MRFETNSPSLSARAVDQGSCLLSDVTSTKGLARGYRGREDLKAVMSVTCLQFPASEATSVSHVAAPPSHVDNT